MGDLQLTSPPAPGWTDRVPPDRCDRNRHDSNPAGWGSPAVVASLPVPSDATSATRRRRQSSDQHHLGVTHSDEAPTCHAWTTDDRDTRAAPAGTALAPAASPCSGALLTPQETAVTKLVALDLSNKETALRLDISVKTAEYHLSHAYAKQICWKMRDVDSGAIAASVDRVRRRPPSMAQFVGKLLENREIRLV